MVHKPTGRRRGVGDAPLGGQLVTSGQPPTVTYLVPASSIWFCALNVRIP